MIIPYITTQEQKIPKLFYQFRFLNRTHVQKLFNHKDKRRINAWLKDLTLKNYIVAVENDYFENSDLGFVNKQSRPLIYHLGINGIRFLKTQDGVDKKFLHKFYRENKRSDEFIVQSLLLADIYLQLLSDTTPADTMTFYTKSDYSLADSKYNFLKELSPNAYIARRKSKGNTKQYLLHIVPESMLRTRSYLLHKVIKGYFELYFSSEWEDQTKTAFPTLLFILPDMGALIRLQRYLQNKLNENDHPKIHFWLATRKQIMQQGFTNMDWEEVD